MRRYTTFFAIAAILAAISASVYLIHYAIFHDAHHIFIYMIGDLGFLPLEVFFVVLVMERILASREKSAILNKLNMVVGAFYSEVGMDLLGKLMPVFEEGQKVHRQFAIGQDWKRQDFKKAHALVAAIEHSPDVTRIDLDGLRSFLIEKRPFMLALLENPNLLEHDRFTDLMWATFHFIEELEARRTLEGLPKSDLAHLNVDVKRLYGHLVAEWLDYAQHTQSNYPFLFSLMVRTNPFRENPSAVVTA